MKEICEINRNVNIRAALYIPFLVGIDNAFFGFHLCLEKNHLVEGKGVGSNLKNVFLTNFLAKSDNSKHFSFFSKKTLKIREGGGKIFKKFSDQLSRQIR